jgi:enterobactin synthetase component F
MAAHAVAALARAEGQRVGSVSLLDAYPSEQWQHLDPPSEAEALVGVLRMGGLDAPSSEGLTRDRVIDELRAAGSALAALPEPVLRGCLASVVEGTRLVRTAPELVLEGDLSVIVAGAPRPETHLDANGWRAHVRGEVHVRSVDATHADLVRRPVSATVARLLTEAMSAARESAVGANS